jgi:hypothetical protein
MSGPRWSGDGGVNKLVVYVDLDCPQNDKGNPTDLVSFASSVIDS